jgi:hypothetical protein
VVWVEAYLQSGENCGGGTTAFIDVRQATKVSPTADWTIISNPVITGASGLPSAFFEIHYAKTDQSAAPLDIEVDMAYLAPPPSTGWR